MDRSVILFHSLNFCGAVLGLSGCFHLVLFTRVILNFQIDMDLITRVAPLLGATSQEAVDVENQDLCLHF